MYRWSYSWDEIKKLYIQQQREIADRTNAFCEFLVELTSAAFGGGSKDSEEYTLDTGEGMDEMSDEQIQKWKDILGEKAFAQQYPDYV